MGAKCSKALSTPFNHLRKLRRKSKVVPACSERSLTDLTREWRTQEWVLEDLEAEDGGIITSSYCNPISSRIDAPTNATVPQAIEETKGKEKGEKDLRRVRFLLPPDEECGSVAEDTSVPETPNTLPPLPPPMKRQTEEVTELMAVIDTTLSQLTQDLTHTEAVEEEDNVSLQFQEMLGEEEDNDSVIFNDCDREKDVACPQPDDAEYDKWSMDSFIGLFLSEDYEILGKAEPRNDGKPSAIKAEVTCSQPDSTEYDTWSMNCFIESFLAEDFRLDRGQK